MAKPTRKTLPKDFADILKGGDMAQMTAVFDSCRLDAYGGYSRRTALGFCEAPVEFLDWLLAQGADLHAPDQYGDTPLHNHAASIFGKPRALVAAGADVDATNKLGGTPLHAAAGAFHVNHVALLLTHRADPDLPNQDGLTPLNYALQRCSNIKLDKMARIAGLLVNSGASVSDRAPAFVTRVGEEFEFHRAAFDKASVDEMSRGLETLYTLFNVPPVPRRNMHDGVSDIVVPDGTWQRQHAQLWDFLVPSSGAAQTVQGEVIRIAGRIGDELHRNGGVNWNKDYAMMADAFLGYVQMGAALPQAEEVAGLVAQAKRKDCDTDRLAELAVAWVALNPKPIALPAPDYGR